MKLSEIAALPAFALLGPGFTGADFALVTGLTPTDSDPSLVFLRYEDEVSFAAFWAGEVRRESLDIDVPAPRLQPVLDAVGHAESVEKVRAAIAAGDIMVRNALHPEVEVLRKFVVLLLIAGCQGPGVATLAGLPANDAGSSATDGGSSDAGISEADAGPPDAGSEDAGSVDAGSEDAGPLDAGPFDAGPPDSGLVDAGPEDAGPLDAGPVDAGPVDAGPVDVGPVDVGPVDAGPFDAGPVDAGPLDAGTGCAANLDVCGGNCTDVSVDRSNCGFCGNVCASDVVCQSGSCKCLTVGQTQCGGKCIDLQSDVNNCGTCGNSCATGASCLTGRCEGWVNVTPATNPPARYSHAMAYDSARGVTVLFGGWNPSSHELGDTWEWDGTAWTNVRPAVSPPARDGHAMVYDAARGVTVLFGGIHHVSGYTSFLGDTWEWDGSNWTDVSPAVSPSRRYSPAMTYDDARGVTVLFSGSTGPTIPDDTWEWDGSVWTQRSPATSAGARFSPAAVYDSGRGVTVICCGWEQYVSENADTWEWDGTLWTQRAENWAGWLSPRFSASMTYDAARGVSVLFGGEVAGFYQSLNDTWEWNGTSWTNVTPSPITSTNNPSSRGDSALVYDSKRSVVVLFGGRGFDSNGWSLPPTNDTWEWTPTNP